MPLIITENTPIKYLSDFGKVPPQAGDMEKAVLGAIMLDTSAMDEVTTLLTSIMFYREAHQKIFEAAFQLYKANKFTDLYSVSESLRNQNELDAVGGPVYITELTSRVVSAANVRQHAMYVKQKYIQRELIRISTELQNRAFDDTYDIAELIEYAEKEIYGQQQRTCYDWQPS